MTLVEALISDNRPCKFGDVTVELDLPNTMAYEIVYEKLGYHLVGSQSN